MIDMWPAGRVLAKVASAKADEAPPTLVTLRIGSPPAPGRQSALAQADVVCPLDEQGNLSCWLPATLLDLSIRTKGFVPQYLWNVEIEADQSKPLGHFLLQRGASVAGWAEASTGQLRPGQGVVNLRHQVAPGFERKMAERLRKPVAEAKLGPRGFFQLDGVAPGTDELEVEHPGFAVARLLPLEVWRDIETSLRDPLVLHPPIPMEVRIMLPLDWLGEHWQAQVARGSDYSAGYEDILFAGQASENGVVRLPNQAPGFFMVEIKDSLANTVFFATEIPVEEEGAGIIEAKVDFVDVRGRLSLDGEPLAASLSFGGQHGAVRMRLRSNRDGQFSGVLPREGKWPVFIEATEPLLVCLLRVEVDPDHRGLARLEIEVPDTELFGRVIDSRGDPVAGAHVGAESDLGGFNTQTDDGGAFSFRGLSAELPTYLAAMAHEEHGLLRSKVEKVALSESLPRGPIELRLSAWGHLNGAVTGDRGPVAGAMLDFVPYRSRYIAGSRALTDFRGELSLLAPGAERLQLIVSPPGHALRATLVDPSEDPLDIAAGREGGFLEVVLEDSPEALDHDGLKVFIFQDALPIPMRVLNRWARGHGVRFFAPPEQRALHAPNLAPGHYRACIESKTLLLEAAAQAAEPKVSLGRCAEGYLTAGGHLRLQLESVLEAP